MDVFAIVRRTLWGIVLTTLLFIGCAYLTVADTLLSKTELATISKNADVAKTIRNDFILPHIIEAGKESDYPRLLTKKLLTQVFNESVPDSALEAKFDPAITATRDWLDSKEPAITFTIDTSDLSEHFISALEKAITKKIASLPDCTYENSLNDAEAGVCRSPYISDKDVKEEINSAIKANPALQLSSITNDDISLPATTHSTAKNLPEYINVLYALSLLASGIALIIALWLMSKHRINGFITIGGTGLALTVVLLVTSALLPTIAAQLSRDTLTTALATATASRLQATLQHEALLIAGASGAIILLFVGIKIFLLRRRPKHTIK